MGAADGVQRRCRVTAESHRGGAVTLCGPDGRTYQVIDAAEAVRERAEELSRGDTARVVLEPVRCRGDGWRITRLEEVTPRGYPLERPISDPEGRSATGTAPR